MSLMLLGKWILLAVKFAGLITVALYALLLCVNLVKERKAVFFGENHFYDLNQLRHSCFSVSGIVEETEEEYAQAIMRLNEYIVKREQGMKPVLTDDIRERFIPIKFKSVLAFTLLEVLDQALVIALVGIMYVFAKELLLL